jgi:hypothetical protein
MYCTVLVAVLEAVVLAGAAALASKAERNDVLVQRLHCIPGIWP